MKKIILAFLLTLCMVVCFTAFTASAEETTEHIHCVCGGAPTSDAANHPCENTTWQPLPEGTTNFNSLSSGYYYLTSDVNVTTASAIENKDIAICLNGRNITTSATRVFNGPKKGSLTITDCSYDVQTKTWDGTITGGTETYGGVTYIRTLGVVNIYGGNITSKDHVHRMGGLIVIAQDGAASGTSSTALKREECGTLNLYNGKLYGGKAGTGGNIHVMHAGVFNMYGGTVTAGEAHYIQWTTTSTSGTTTTTTKYGYGGNIIIDAKAEMNLYGGVVSDGKAVQNDSSKTYSSGIGLGGNIYNSGTLNVYGGTVSGGIAEHDPVTNADHSAYVTNTNGHGRGGNIYTTNTLNISHGEIYGGQAYGNGGGNIYMSGGTFNLSGGKIWGGVANADQDTEKSEGLVNSYDVCGGSIRIANGTINMTGGSIGIDAEGKPAGGTCYPSGSEAGNVYFSTTTAIGNFSGGEIAYGNVIGLNADGSEIHGSISKGGNIGGSAKITYSDSIIVRDGYATNGGNITLFNSGNTTIIGGKIYGGTATSTGGNIIFGGNKTDGTVYTLTISGGEIYGGSAANGGNIYASEYNNLSISGGKIYDGTATTSGGNIRFIEHATAEITGGEIFGGTATTDGGNIIADANTNLSIKNITISGGSVTGGGGGNILSSGTVTLENVKLIGGTCAKYAGGNLRMNSSTANLTMTGCTLEGGSAGSYGGNLYLEKKATITDCSFTSGTTVTRGGNVYLNDTAEVTITGCTFTGGRADNETKTFTYGGNLYSVANTLIVTGTSFDGGAAQSAGNVYVNSGTVEMTDCTFKNGIANLCTDGSTNGNGGNLQVSADADVTLTGCIFEGGVAQRGGSIGAFGSLSMIDCSVGAADAAFGGATIFVYQNGYINLSGNTVITGGTCKESGSAILFNTFAENAGENIIGDGVQIISGSAGIGNGIYLSNGTLKLEGAPQIQDLHVCNNTATAILDVSELTATEPITLTCTMLGQFGVASTDKIGCFVSGQDWGLKYEDGALYTHAPRTLYISNDGSDTAGYGTQNAPFQTLNYALEMIEDGGIVNIVDVVDVDAFEKHDKHVTLTGGELNITNQTRVEIMDHIHFKNMTLTIPAVEYYIYCNGYTTVIDSDVTVRYYDGTNYTDTSTNSFIFGGCRGAYQTTYGNITGTDLTVLSGTWGHIYGGNNNCDLTGDVHLTVGGSVNKDLDYATTGHDSSTNYYNRTYGGSRLTSSTSTANISGTIYMTVTGGKFNSVFGGSYGATTVDAVELHITGGEGMAAYGAGLAGEQTIGTVNFYFEGGYFEQVFGGALSRALTGDVNMYITGGQIARRLYGGCYNTYSFPSWSTKYYVTGAIQMFIGEDTNISCDLTQHSDRGIFGHSRRPDATTADAENTSIIFLTKAAYNNNSSKLHAIDSTTAILLSGVPTADLILYLDWSADDVNDVISSNATAVKDPETGVTGNASAYNETASMTLSGTSFYYNGNAHEPANVTVSDNWSHGETTLTYTDNTAIGTATATLTANGYSVSATFNIAKKDDVAQIGDTKYAYLQDAVDALAEGGYMQILIDCDENATISKSIYLDLAGNSLTGKVTVAEGAVLYGMDSTTDDYDCTEGYGEITDVTGEVSLQYKTSVTGKVRRYLTYTDPETGAKSFHRIYLGVTSMSLRPAVTGVGYKATFRADHIAQSMLHEVEAFGYNLWLDGMETKLSCTKTRDELDNTKTVTLRIQGMPVDTYGETKVFANVYMKLSDGTTITSSDSYFTFRQMLEAINTAVENNPEAYTEVQMNALQNMLASYTAFLQDAGWAISSILPQA